MKVEYELTVSNQKYDNSVGILLNILLDALKINEIYGFREGERVKVIIESIEEVSGESKNHSE